MKNTPIVIAFLTTITGMNSYASQVLTCWDKYDSNNHNPALTAKIESTSVLSNIIFGDENVSGPLAGAINPRARKYAGWYQFGWNWKSGEAYSVLSLPPNINEESGYFYAAIQTVTTGGGGVLHLNCRVR